MNKRSILNETTDSSAIADHPASGGLKTKTSLWRCRFSGPQVALALAALVACVTSHPGSIPADTKLYLYLDPRRLISDSIWSWDSRLFAGWVPHQNVGYLWPTGPFYAFFDALHVPDWFAQRLWMALLLIIAGSGACHLARRLGLSSAGCLIAGAAYQFSPYVLPYISRTSALLLPWSLLPWLIAFALRFLRERRSRDLALFGLLIFSSGGLNATALLVLAPAPVIWLYYVHRWNRSDSSSDRKSLVRVVAQLGCVSLLVSAWWLAGLAIQGRYGAAVLSYSEALQSTSATSSAPEVLRGLGYWLFYDRGPVAPLTSASGPYQSSLLLIATGALLVVLGLIGIIHSGRWRAPLGATLIVGVFISVGAHPYSDANLVFGPLADNPKNALSLALRSSTRAVPMIVLALALGLGFAWHNRSVMRDGIRSRLAFGSLILMIVGNLPAAVTGDLADPALLRPNDLPAAWHEAATFLDQRYDSGDTGAVLLLPGIESAAYRWGYPVDPILPGISRKPLVTRDWLPLGSPAVMDLLYALDDSLQNGTADPDSIAPVARMLGADTVMFVTSHQYERFDTVRPARAFDLFDPVPSGLSFLARFGTPVENRSSPANWSEESVLYPTLPLPEILLFSVDGRNSGTRIHPGASVASTDGTGLVDLSAMGDLDGTTLTFSEASMDDEALISVLDDAHHLIITDSNRRRAHHWRSSQDVWGATEPDAGVLSVSDDFDSRLPVHPGQHIESETMIESARVEATATGYGAELRYNPEFRPRMAVDGNPATAWRLGPDRSPIGHVLTVQAHDVVSELRLLQPLDVGARQWITRISVRTGRGPWTSTELTSDSRRVPGQRIPLAEPSREVDIRIEELNDDRLFASSLGVGFAEVVEAPRTTPEVVVLPRRLAAVRDSVNGSFDVTYSLNRLRSDPLDRWRDDPETSMLRRFPSSLPGDVNVTFEIRLSPRATDAVLARQLGWDGGVSTTRLHGSARWWGPAAFDADGTTLWMGPVSTDTRAQGLGSFVIPVDSVLRWIVFEHGDVTSFSTVARVSIEFRSANRVVGREIFDVPAPDVTGRARLDVPNEVSPAVPYDTVAVEILDVHAFPVRDGFTGRSMAAPVALSEIRSDSWENVPLARTFDTGCRSDLVQIDARPIPLRLTGSISAALAGEPVSATVCPGASVDIRSGSLLETSPGTTSGWDIDRLRIMASASTPSDSNVEPSSILVPFETNRASFSADVPPCSGRCWVETPFGASNGWKATLEGTDLGPPMRSASGRSLWDVSNDQPGMFEASWAPQTWMWLGLAISGVTVLALLGVLVIDSWRSRRTGRRLVESLWACVAVFEPNRRLSRTRLAITGLVLGTAFVSPLWGLLIAVAFLLLSSDRLSTAAVCAVALGYAAIIVQQVRVDPVPGFGWPSVFARAHEPMLAVLIVFVVALHAPHPVTPLRSQNESTRLPGKRRWIAPLRRNSESRRRK